jgi:hypothetical protein
MGTIRKILFSCVDDEFCKISVRTKFEIKKLEAYCCETIRTENDLTEEKLIALKVIYTTLAKYYERLVVPLDGSKKTVNSKFCAFSFKRGQGLVSKSILLASFQVIQKVQRQIILTSTRSDKVSVILRMGELCREFSSLLEEFLRQDTTKPELHTSSLNLPVFSSRNTGVDGPSYNEKLESLFRALEQ